MLSEKYSGEGLFYQVGLGIKYVNWAKPYKRSNRDPLYRPLRVYTLDPSIPAQNGAVTTLKVPFEPLKPGPEGALFSVDNVDNGKYLPQVDLDAPKLLMGSGHKPSPSNREFHQQMVYAVCATTYTTFQRALGRELLWGFQIKGDCRKPLQIRPHAINEQNAYYDSAKGELCFGYYRSETSLVSHGDIYTCLSHDIIVHEVTHALLDSLRTRFTVPTGLDVLAFHEAFADLVAIFQHFTHKDLLLDAIQASRGNLENANLLTEIAREFGYTLGHGHALRTAIDTSGEDSTPNLYKDSQHGPHELGSVLTSAVFDAFLTIFKRKSGRLLRLASGGTGIVRPGVLPLDLQNELASLAGKIANQFLNIIIRAIDYCPPIDLELGEFLRAVITADYDLVPDDDKWNYREAWIDAFRKRGIIPPNVAHLSEDALLWQGPERQLNQIDTLAFNQLNFDTDPSRPANKEELHRQACMLGQSVAQPQYIEEFGCALSNDRRLKGDIVDLPTIESIRTSQRVGPDGNILYDLVAEIIQCRKVQVDRNRLPFDFYGGATVIIGPTGEIRYVIRKSILDKKRLERQTKFMQNKNGGQYWVKQNHSLVPNPQLMRHIHESKSTDEK